MQRKYLLKNIRVIIPFLILGIVIILITVSKFQIFKNRELSISDLKFLEAGMSYDEIIAHIGSPDRETGSDVRRFEYDLQGGETLLLFFVRLDYLERGVIVEKDGDEVVIAPCVCCPFQEYTVIPRTELGFIKEGISYNEVVAHLGEPSCNVGSGVYLFVYELEDGGRLIVGFSNLDYLDQAAIFEKDGTSKGLLR